MELADINTKHELEDRIYEQHMKELAEILDKSTLPHMKNPPDRGYEVYRFTKTAQIQIASIHTTDCSIYSTATKTETVKLMKLWKKYVDYGFSIKSGVSYVIFPTGTIFLTLHKD